jgi:uncharacterized protein (DUF433 family)
MAHDVQAPLRWQDYISFDRDILGGKPAIKGTRLGVQFILQRLVDGWSMQDLLEAYPGLTEEQVRACIDYALDGLESEQILDFPRRP